MDNISVVKFGKYPIFDHFETLTQGQSGARISKILLPGLSQKTILEKITNSLLGGIFCCEIWEIKKITF